MSDKKKNTQIGHLITHTHWDREWRVPVWHARKRLIAMLEHLLASLESNPAFKHFLFDGQVVGVDDYLEVCPENTERVKQLIKDGRIQIGPWYNLPDEYPVCGEALIRNLLTGVRRAQEYGHCMKVGYLSFGWGQTAQLPQIFAGFGIDFVFVGKRISKERAPHSEFLWKAPDGTTLLATRLGTEGRANFYFSAIMPAMYGRDYHDPECKIHWGQEGWLWRRADKSVDLETTCIRQPQYHPERIRQSMDDAWHTTDDTLVPEHRFLGNGTDSTGPYACIEQLIEDANALGDGRTIRHSSIETYVAAVRQTLEKRGLEMLISVEGELRDGPSFAVSGNALATRMYLKSLNRLAQTRLIRYAEPLSAIARMYGMPFPQTFLDKAWQYLLLAHSHDAINGVTLDKTARDTAYKLEQVVELAEVVMDGAASELLQKIDVSAFTPEEVLVAVFNLSCQGADFVAHTQIDMPEDFNPEWLNIVDDSGRFCTVQPLGAKHIASPVNVVNSRAMPFYCDRHAMYFQTGIIPAMGYKVFKAVPRGKLNRKTEFWNNVYDLGTQITGPLTMANRYIEVAFDPNGTFDLRDKQTGRRYAGLGYFEDSGEAGDYWQRISPWKNSTFTTLSTPAEIALVEDGPLVTSFLCQWTLHVPEKMLRAEGRRADVKVPLKISSKVTLKADTPYVEIKTTISNQAMDHRLRACFPTYIDAVKADAQGHFNVDSRPIGRARDACGVRDDGMGTLPMQHFVDITDKDGGLGFLNRNLIEYEVSEDPARIVALTLLRSVPVRICTEHRCATEDASQLGGQCLGEHTFEYALYPHRGDVWSGDVHQAADHYQMCPLAYQFSKHSNAAAVLPQSRSFVTIEPATLQMAAFKKAQDSDACILRLYNPSDKAVSGKLMFAVPPKAIELMNLNEELRTPLTMNAGGCLFTFEPYKIVTFRLVF